MPPGGAAVAKNVGKWLRPAMKRMLKASSRSVKSAGKKAWKKTPKPVQRALARVRSHTVSARRYSKIKGGTKLARSERKAINKTLRHIDRGTRPPNKLFGGGPGTPPNPMRQGWGRKFKNLQGRLPGKVGKNSPYKEYRVQPGRGVTGGGARRIVVDDSTGRMYYSNTHYGDAGKPHFIRIK